MKNKIFRFSAAFLMISALFSGCRKSSAKEDSVPLQETSHKPVIGFSIDTLAIERWNRELDIFIAEAKELGAEVLVQNAGNVIETQKQQLDYFIKKNVDVVVIVPKEADAYSEQIQKFRNKNIPVIAYDRLILNSNINLYVTIDCQQVGYLMGKEMYLRSDSQNWIRILGPRDDYNVILAVSGFEKAMKNTYISTERTYYTPGWNYDLSRRKMEEIIMDGVVPDTIICGNDAIATSIIPVLQSYYPNKKIHICGQDGDIAACQNIVKGLQDFTIYKPITTLAQIAAQYAVKFATQAPSSIEIPENRTINNDYAEIPMISLAPQVVTKENIDKIIIDSGFHTHNEVYGD